MTVGVGDVIRVVAEWDIPDGTIAQLVYHFIGISGTTATEAQVGAGVLAALAAAWLHIDQDIGDRVLGSVIETYLWDFVLNRWDGIDVRPQLVTDGLSVGEMMSHGTALLGKIFTGVSRRQSRKYIHGLTETRNNDGTWDATALSAAALFLNDLNDDINVGGLNMAYCTFNTDPLSPLFETDSQANQTVQAEAICAYQRRRRPGTGI